MTLKTFEEFKESNELHEATIGQWAGRSAATGAAIGGAVGLLGMGAATGLATGGLALAIPLATWGAVSMGINGLIGGALFAGGQARKDFKELKKLMKKIEKYQTIEPKQIKPKTVASFETDLNRALFLTRKLKTSLNSDMDIGSSKGVFRTDIKQTDKFIMELEKMEQELDEVVKRTSKAKSALKRAKK
ncbi:hypothetical protein VPHF86_0174 [Vibrio phage F86]